MSTHSKTMRAGKISLLKRGKLPPPVGFARRKGEPEGRCPYCSFQPTNRADFCDKHKPWADRKEP